MKRTCLEQNAEKQRDCVSWRVSWCSKSKKSKKSSPKGIQKIESNTMINRTFLIQNADLTSQVKKTSFNI